jgi:CelD/BcsL family acetyltransferase involved in cellulose biosynthesis
MNHTLMQTNDPRWMDFIVSCPEANIFHHPAWMELMSDCYGYKPNILAILDEDNSVCAGLPFMDVISPITGRRRVSLPFTDYCNPLYRDKSSHEVLTSQLIRMFEAERLKRLEVRWCLPAIEQIQQKVDFVLHHIRLNPDPQMVSKNFKRTHLQNIHTAEERGVKTEFGDKLSHIRAFYNLQLETRKRHGVPAQPWKYFELLWHHIINKEMGFVLLAKKDDEVIAGMIYLGWGNTLIAKYAASREDHFNLRPNNLLFWDGICWGCRNGFVAFDMGRTEIENTGLRNFKSRWGAVEEPLVYSILSRSTFPHSNDKLKHAMHSVIQHSPAWVCRLSGELFYRYFG